MTPPPDAAAGAADRWTVAALPPLPREALAGMVAGLAPGLPLDVVTPPERTPDGVRRVLADADLVLGDWSGMLALGPAEVAAAPRLAFVQQPSVGTDSIDLDAFAAAGIPVANTAGFNTASVAEWCVAATIAGLRSMVWAVADLAAGGWAQSTIAAQRQSSELAGRRVGLVGFGSIGQALATRFAAFGCPVSYWSRTRRPAELEHGATYRELDDLLAAADVLVVVIALGPATRDLLDAAALARLPQGAYLVNAARGGILDEAALLAAVRSGALHGAALDVYATEPLPADSPLRGDDRILLSPHAAGTTVQSSARLVTQAVGNLAAAVRGEPVADVVNGVEPVVRRRR